MKAFKCDKCGEFHTYSPNVIAPYYDDYRHPKRKVELCRVCYASIKGFLPNTYAILSGYTTENEG